MPQRFLKPGLRNSERWNACTEGAQGLYIRLLTVVDDYGRYDGRPAVILSDCYSVFNAVNAQCPHDVVTVTAMLRQLADKKLISFYVCIKDGAERTFIQFEQWSERPRVASKWPEPKPEMLSPCWHNAVSVTAPCQPPVPCSPVPCSPLSPQPSSPAEPATPTIEPAKEEPKQPTKKFVKPDIAMCKLHAAKIGLPDTEAVKFWNYYESKGWFVGRSPMRSWQAAMVTWRGNWQERNPGRASAIAPKSPPPTQKGGAL